MNGLTTPSIPTGRLSRWYNVSEAEVCQMASDQDWEFTHYGEWGEAYYAHEPLRAVVVGRHAPDFGNLGVEVTSQEAVTFPAKSTDCESILVGLMQKAADADAALILQNAPAQVAAAFVRLFADREALPTDAVGIIVSVPGDRPAGVTHKLGGLWNDEYQHDFAEDAGALVLAVNPRAKVTYPEHGYIEVTVDPPMPFIFSHIEWL